VTGGDPHRCLIAREPAGVATFLQKILKNEKSKNFSERGGKDGTFEMNPSKAFTEAPSVHEVLRKMPTARLDTIA
jgi:hypothetical protein